jgi:molecular chaperone DnaJ
MQQSILGLPVTMRTTCPRCGGEGEIISTPCTNCRGQKRLQMTRKINVQVPAGVDDGTQIRLAGEGESGTRGGQGGNLYVVVTVKKHPLFKRDGLDLLLDLPVNIVQAALGDEVEVPTLNGNVSMKLPSGTQHGQTFRIKDQGVPRLQRSGRGDIVVTAKIMVPRDLNEKQKELLRELGKTIKSEPLSRDKSVLGKVKDAFK